MPWTINENTITSGEKRALIIGGGLAGCHSARALAERGWSVRILERHSALAQEGSGNPQGVLYAKLSPLDEAQAAFNLASLQYALHFYRPLWKTIGDQCGVLQLAYKNAEADLHELLKDRFAHADQLVEFVSAETASQLAGLSLTQSGLYFPQAGWIDPRKLCAHLVCHPNIKIEYGFQVAQLHYGEDNWQVDAINGDTQHAPVVIIASAKDAVNLDHANHLPIKSIRGQVSYIPQDTAAVDVSTVVCAEGYISPAQAGVFCTGATFNLKDTETATRISDHQTNLDNLNEHLPSFKVSVNAEDLDGRVAFRCSLPDYLPCVGALPLVDQLVKDFAPLRKNARAGITASGSYWPGLYVNIGHGARGLAYTPLSAEILAAQINGEHAPVPRELVNALNPARFIVRDLIRNKR